MDVKLVYVLFLIGLLKLVSTQTTYTWLGTDSNNAAVPSNWMCTGPECVNSGVPTGGASEIVSFQSCTDQVNLILVSGPADVFWGVLDASVDSCANITFFEAIVSIRGATPGTIERVTFLTTGDLRENQLTWVDNQPFNPRALIVDGARADFIVVAPETDIPFVQMGFFTTTVRLENFPAAPTPGYRIRELVSDSSPGLISRSAVMVDATVQTSLTVDNIIKTNVEELSLETFIQPLTMNIGNIECVEGQVIISPTASPNFLTGVVNISPDCIVALSEDSSNPGDWEVSGSITGPGTLEVFDNMAFNGQLTNVPIIAERRDGIELSFNDMCNGVSLRGDDLRAVDITLSGSCEFTFLDTLGDTVTITSGGNFRVDELRRGTVVVSNNAALTVKSAQSTPTVTLSANANLNLDVTPTELSIPTDLIVTPSNGATISFLSGTVNVLGADPWNGASVMLDIQGGSGCFQEAPTLPMLTLTNGEISKDFTVGEIKFIGGTVLNSQITVTSSADFEVEALFNNVSVTITQPATATFKSGSIINTHSDLSRIVIEGTATVEGDAQVNGNAIVENTATGNLILASTANLAVPNYTQTGTLTVNIDGTNSGSITCSDTTMLGGNLNLIATNAPETETTYTIVDCSTGSISTQFAMIDFDNSVFGGVEQNVVNNQLIITVRPLGQAVCQPGDRFDFNTPGKYRLYNSLVGAVAPPFYGLRLDGLLDKKHKEVATFNFIAKGSFVTLEFNGTHPLRIST